MIIPFKKEHLEVMAVREHERGLLSDHPHLENLEKSYAMTGILDGRIIACGGVLPFGNGNAEIWLIPSIYVPEYAKETYLFIRKWLLETREAMGLRRMQTACIDDELHTGWMTHLGFTNETPNGMANYSGDLTFNMWARTWA